MVLKCPKCGCQLRLKEVGDMLSFGVDLMASCAGCGYSVRASGEDDKNALSAMLIEIKPQPVQEANS